MTRIQRFGERTKGPVEIKSQPDERMQGALDIADEIESSKSPEQYRELRGARGSVLDALRAGLADLSGIRRGFKPPTTDALVKRHAAHLPADVRAELGAFLEEAASHMAEGEGAGADSPIFVAARKLAGELGTRMVEEDWRPDDSPAPVEDPAELAARISR